MPVLGRLEEISRIREADQKVFYRIDGNRYTLCAVWVHDGHHPGYGHYWYESPFT